MDKSNISKILYRVLVVVLLSVISIGIYNVQNHLEMLEVMAIEKKASITEKEAAKLLNMTTKEFKQVVKDHEILKEEALGLPIDRNAFLQWTYDVNGKEKRFNPKQIKEWVYFNTTNKEPIFKE